jgi:RNA 2',3'-cyclic 3'-phosphodiesterase
VKDAWRCFVAVTLGDELRATLASSVATWQAREDLAGLRWSDPVSWHLTLAFLGDLEPASIRDVTGRLATVAAGHPPMTLFTGGLGGFPSDSRARVAWYGVEGHGHRLRRLADDVGRAVDLDPDRPFNGHVTLGRARGAAVDLRAWVRDGRPPRGQLGVERIELMRSHVGRGPAHYETLASVPLGRPAS